MTTSGEPALDALYAALAYVLDHEDEMRSGWHEAATVQAQLRERGFRIVREMSQEEAPDEWGGPNG